MLIHHLSKASGIAIETIRFYERDGLLPHPQRLENRYRDYNDTHVERLAFIRHCRELDMPLAEVRALIAAIDTPNAPHPNVDRLISEQIMRVRSKLKSMRSLEKELRLLLDRCGRCDDGEVDCGILKELVTNARRPASVHGLKLKPNLN